MIKPLGQRVLIERVENSEKESLIIIPESAKEKSSQAYVVMLGSGTKNENGTTLEFTVAVGDLIILSQYQGIDVVIKNKKYQIINECDIMGIVK